jgi:hypothetical protein
MHSPGSRLSSNLRSLDDFKSSTIAVLFVLLVAIASIPIITHTLPPLSDYLNHLGRTYIINKIGFDPDLTRFYFTRWQALPNLIIDIVMLALNPFMDIYRAGRVFIVTAFILIISGTLALNRALFGRWSALPLVGVPLLYNGVMLVGVMNYLFGIGLALWALASWVALRDRSWPIRLAVSTLFALALFICHLCAMGFYGLVILALESRRLWDNRAKPLGPRLVEFISAGLPIVLAGALLGISPTMNSITDYNWMIGGKIDGLFMAVDVYYAAVAFGLLACTFAAAAWARWQGILLFHPIGWMVLALGSVVYVAMPRELFAAYMADQRPPIALVFVLIACFQVEFRNSLVRQSFIALLFVMLAARVLEVQVV